MTADYVSPHGLTRQQLVDMLHRLMFDMPESEEECDALILEIDRNLPAPGLTDLIYYSEPPLGPEEIIDRIIGTKPIELYGPDEDP